MAETEPPVAATVPNTEGMTNKEARLAKKAARAETKAAAAAKPHKEDLRGKSDGKKRKRTAPTEAEGHASEAEEGGDASDDTSEPETAEQEAISHKEARKRRKLAKEASKRAEKGLPPKEPQVEHTKEKDTRSPFALWVGNMSFKTTSEKLVEWLEDKQIHGISRVAMPKGLRKGEKNRGYAYVDVPSQAEVDIGIRMSELELDGRKLLIKSGGDFSGRPGIPQEAVQAGTSALSEAQKERPGLPKTAAAILRKQRHPPAETLFFGNLSFKTTVDDIEMMLTRAADARMAKAQKKAAAEGQAQSEGSNSDSEGEEEGEKDPEAMDQDQPEKSEKPKQEHKKKEKNDGSVRGAGIRKIRMGTFEDAPEKCKGWAFVDFHTLGHATASLIDAPTTHRLLGRQLEVAYASPDAVRRGAKRSIKATDTQRPKPQRLSKSAREAKRQLPVPAQAQTDAPMRAWGAATAQEEATAPPPAPFDPTAPVPKAHKPTQEERAAARAAKKGGSSRPAPGAALAQAQRAPAAAAPAGTKTTFD